MTLESGFAIVIFHLDFHKLALLWWKFDFPPSCKIFALKIKLLVKYIFYFLSPVGGSKSHSSFPDSGFLELYIY